MYLSLDMFLLVILFLLLSFQHVHGVIYQIASGDIDDFIVKFNNTTQPGDVILLEPGIYNFFDIAPVCETNCYTCDAGECCDEYCNEPYDIGDYAPSNKREWKWDDETGERFHDKGIIIRGTGNKPTDTVLHGIMTYPSINLIVENLSLSAKLLDDAESVFEADDDTAVVFRDCRLIASENDMSGRAVDLMSLEVTFIRTTIVKEGGPSNTGYIGVDAETLRMFNSKVMGFDVGISGYLNFTEDDRLFKTQLSMNTVECEEEDECTTLQLQIPNTRKGPNVILKSLPDLMNDDLDPLPIRVKFPLVIKAGETIVYKLPSAYPEFPAMELSSGIGKPMYFQFHSTAVFDEKKGNLLFFEKNYIDFNFENPNKVKALFYENGSWKNNPPISIVSVGNKLYYRVRCPKSKLLTGLIAFAE